MVRYSHRFRPCGAAKAPERVWLTNEEMLMGQLPKKDDESKNRWKAG